MNAPRRNSAREQLYTQWDKEWNEGLGLRWACGARPITAARRLELLAMCRANGWPTAQLRDAMAAAQLRDAQTRAERRRAEWAYLQKLLLREARAHDEPHTRVRACRQASWGLETAAPTVGAHTRASKRKRPACGARCRGGRPCKARAVWRRGEAAPRNGRCRMHGGLSTGPRTPEGKAAIVESNRRRARIGVC